MSKWDKYWLLELHRLLERKGGYEIVSALLSSENNELAEKEIVIKTGGPKSTIEEWLQDARKQGVVKTNVSDDDGRMVRTWILKSEAIPSEIEPLIEERGKMWRDNNENHADVAGYSEWVGGPDLLNLILSLEPGDERYVSLDNLDLGRNID